MSRSRVVDVVDHTRLHDYIDYDDTTVSPDTAVFGWRAAFCAANLKSKIFPPLTPRHYTCSNRIPMRLLLVPLVAAVLGLAGCVCPKCPCKVNTLETRKDLWGPAEVEGPYTRMLKYGIPEPSSPYEAPADGRAAAKPARSK